MGPVCTIMVGRLDDWLKVIQEKAGPQSSGGDAGMGRHRSIQENVQDISRARLSGAPACRSVPQRHALE